MRFASPHSAGATCATVGQTSNIMENGNGSAPPKRVRDAADDQVSNKSPTIELFKAWLTLLMTAYNQIIQQDSAADNWRVSAVQVCVPLPPWAIRAGARETIYHDPSAVNCAIVTCGGLCPGLNDVVQGIVRKLEDYGVPDGNILGIR